MASTTITGRVFFALGMYLVTSIFNNNNNNNNNNNDSEHLQQHRIQETMHLRTDPYSSPNISIKKKLTTTASGSTTIDEAITNNNDIVLFEGHTKYTNEAKLDRITRLPGLTYEPEFKQFSGYLDTTATKHIFYWYIESQSNPDTDPVVLWTNGGPGCSGLIGFGTENGPYHINGKGKITPNIYSWNRIANMLYIEQPAGVGFSYFDNEEDGITGDDTAASDNYQTILRFLERFPHRKSNPFYIASESYGGHYMPQLAIQILQSDPHHELINFKGMMVGNPFVDPYTNVVTEVRAYYNHGLLAKPLFDKWVKTCENPDTYSSDECADILDDMFFEFGPGINPYALDYPVCLELPFLDDEVYEFDLRDEEDARKEKKDKKHKKRQDKRQKQTADDKSSEGGGWIRRLSRAKTYSSQVNSFLNFNEEYAAKPPFQPSRDTYKPCGEVHLERYLNRHDVRLALHVREEGGIVWHPCDDEIDYSEEDFNTSVINLYKELIKMAVAQDPDNDMKYMNDLNVLIFSGDNDSIASTVGTQDWIWDLGIPPKSHDEWMAWKVDNQTAGFVVHFQLPGNSNSSWTFATVHGAGHEVPAYRPYEALQLFAMYLDRTL